MVFALIVIYNCELQHRRHRRRHHRFKHIFTITDVIVRKKQLYRLMTTRKVTDEAIYKPIHTKADELSKDLEKHSPLANQMLRNQRNGGSQKRGQAEVGAKADGADGGPRKRGKAANS